MQCPRHDLNLPAAPCRCDDEPHQVGLACPQCGGDLKELGPDATAVAVGLKGVVSPVIWYRCRACSMDCTGGEAAE